MPQPRPVAQCIIRRDGRVLLIRIKDPLTGRKGWRAPGGGIEFGETAEQAVRREIREELGVDLVSLRQLATLDGMIEWQGVFEHEIVFLFEASPTDWSALTEPRFVRLEANGRPLDLRWVSPEDVRASGEVLYPEGLAPHLFGHRSIRSIRPVALCAFRRGSEVLAFEAWDGVKQQRFRRFPGGGIEFGETAEEAVRREMREELDTELQDLRLLGVVDSRFVFQGQPGHEHVFVFEAALPDPARYESLDAFRLADNGGWTDMAWVSIDELRDPLVPLVPEEVVDLLLHSL
jgi:ADP-ribose pyrophosphatase YjhB (NUDIX family)